MKVKAKTKKKEQGCQFSVAWVGRCHKGTAKFCPEHRKEKCAVCGEQATRGCDHTSALVCGFPLCGSCDHGHGSN